MSILWLVLLFQLTKTESKTGRRNQTFLCGYKVFSIPDIYAQTQQGKNRYFHFINIKKLSKKKSNLNKITELIMDKVDNQNQWPSFKAHAIWIVKYSLKKA